MGRKIGRPTKFSQKLADEFLNLVKAGNHIRAACAYVGLSHPTIYAWAAEGERRQKGELYEFSTALKKALASAEIRSVALISTAAQGRAPIPARFDENGQMTHPGAAGVDASWQAAAWYLERRNPRKWGLRVRLSVDEELNDVLTRLEAKLPPDIFELVLAAATGEEDEGPSSPDEGDAPHQGR